MSDYTHRLAEAILSLEQMAFDAADDGKDSEADRLRGEAQGVRLAMSYAVEMHL